MRNVFFEDEEITVDDLYFICSMIERPPTPLQMGKVYKRLILNTLQSNEDYIQGLIRVYNAEICETIDNYNCSAYYEPSPMIARSYYNGYF